MSTVVLTPCTHTSIKPASLRLAHRVNFHPLRSAACPTLKGPVGCVSPRDASADELISLLYTQFQQNFLEHATVLLTNYSGAATRDKQLRQLWCYTIQVTLHNTVRTLGKLLHRMLPAPGETPTHTQNAQPSLWPPVGVEHQKRAARHGDKTT